MANKCNCPKQEIISYTIRCPIDKGSLDNGHKCNCLKQEIIIEAYKMSNISRMLEKESFTTLDTSISPSENIGV